jgi:hypothetical protein
VGARLVVAETVVNGLTPSRLVSQMDLTMLVTVGGRERTAAEFHSLLGRAGFEITAITPTSTPFSLIEAVAV